ncbi:winged helix-turn-helix transcriptional regulator [Tessaracoccus palaemonis]|uniref:Helix-turn-helix transcriptional regulator n=1 Tax=Tessaracoccus palaemonis TaxID=2829499 RepID=A0ABX8SPU7_9ACTN|nr:helix-turn-helix domain-containing protein [Tessaracoccus palaemonis]QXT63239.1 helix-turn-helix transcriptional regulator [Tessaracoccus palaemonis]
MVDTQQAPDVMSAACPSRPTLQHLTGRWGALTMAALAHGTQRFSEIRRRIEGISDRMLSQTLGDLERDGMVERTVLSAIPPKVTYALTPLGVEVADRLEALITLVEANMDEVTASRDSYDATH